MVGVVPKSGKIGPAEWAESSDGAIGPEPMLNPATTERAAAATAPAATRGLRAKYSLGATAVDTMAREGASGSGCPNEREVNTSSKLASSPALAHPGSVPLITLRNSSVSSALAARIPSSETQTPLNFHHITLGSL